ncbi:MAG: hypothetical protein WHU10_00005 [Fimbriimonadales bacterium]
MALSNATEWEVRTDGNDLNGGGFNSTRSGATKTATDNYTYGPSYAVFSGTNLTVDSVTNTYVQPDGYTPVTADIGHVIQISGGTGWTTGFYEIVGLGGGRWILDRSPAAAGTAGGVWRLGGALATPGKAGAAHVGGNLVWIKSGTYQITNTTANTSGGPVTFQAGVSTWTALIGYTSARGDFVWNSLPVIQNMAGSNVNVPNNRGRTLVANIEFRGTNNATRNIAISASRLLRCRFVNIRGTFGHAFGCHYLDSGDDPTNGIGGESLVFYTLFENCRYVSGSVMYRCMLINCSEIEYRGGNYLIQCVDYSTANPMWTWSDDTRGAIWIDCIRHRPTAGGTAFPLQPQTQVVNCAAYNWSSLFSGNNQPRQLFQSATNLTAQPLSDPANGNYTLTDGALAQLINGGWDAFSYLFDPSDATKPGHYTKVAQSQSSKPLNLGGGFNL